MPDSSSSEPAAVSSSVSSPIVSASPVLSSFVLSTGAIPSKLEFNVTKEKTPTQSDVRGPDTSSPVSMNDKGVKKLEKELASIKAEAKSYKDELDKGNL